MMMESGGQTPEEGSSIGWMLCLVGGECEGEGGVRALACTVGAIVRQVCVES